MSDSLSSELASLRIDRSAAGVPRRKAGPWPWLAGLAAALAAGVSAWPYVESRIFKTEVSLTEVVEVSPVQASLRLTATGFVVPERSSTVAVQVAGLVAKVNVQRGQVVSAGDVLFELDIANQKAAIAAAQSRVQAGLANVATARANLAETELAAQRARAMAAQGVGPKGSAEDLEARVAALSAQTKAAQAQVNAAAAEVQALTTNLGFYVVKAPISGTILNKPPELGEFVGPQPTGLSVDMGGLEIADLSSLVVETDVAEQRLSLVEVGLPAEIALDAYPERRFSGKVLEVIPKVNRAKATVVVKVGFSEPTVGVMPDMAARVSFLSEAPSAEALAQPSKRVVPANAVAERGGRRVVFVVNQGTVREVEVELGPPSGTGFELKSGPAPGARLVKDPPKTLADGQRIKESQG
jgi:HlyD family secretion protein